MLQDITIILQQPSHPGNIGATARAMKNMGLSQLILVKPKSYPDPIATARAANASVILDNAIVIDSLAEALNEFELVFACAADIREHSWPVSTPEQMTAEIKQKHAGRKIAIVFGRESTGLNNDELKHCHAQIKIPSCDEYHSLNLAQAVQVVCYELYKGLSGFKIEQTQLPLANQSKCEAIYQHLQRIAELQGYYDPQRPLNFTTRVRQIIKQSMLKDSDADLLLGVLKRL